MNAASVREALERILASPGFDASARNRRFLEYLVEETLAGRADRLKGLTIAIDVFGRDAATFDRAARSGGPHRGGQAAPEAGKLLPDRRPGGPDPDRHSEGHLRAHFRGAGTAVPGLARAGRRTRRGNGAVSLAPPRQAALALGRDRPPRRSFLGALGWLGTDLLAFRLWSGGSEDAATALPRGPKIAVLPFLNLSGDPAQAYFAQGVADQIVTDLARFKALFVLSMESTAKYQEQLADPQQLKRELGADYLLDGSVRRERDKIRLSTRLVDTESGGIIWSETYADALTPSNVFEIQDDVAQQVSAIVASNYGMIAESDLTGAQRRPPESFAAYDCVLRYYQYQKSFDPREHAKVRACLERAVELDPGYSDAWAVLANVYAQEHRFGFNPRPELYDSYEHSLTAAYRAVEIEPRNPTAQLMLANALFDRRNLAGFRAAGERAIALNPNDPDLLAHYGTRLVYMGEWERGLALVMKAIALNPEHPQWYLDPVIYYHYQTGDYERAWTEAQSQGVAGDIWVAAVQGDDPRPAGSERGGAAPDRSGAEAQAGCPRTPLGHGADLERARPADRADRGRPAQGRPRHRAPATAFVI